MIGRLPTMLIILLLLLVLERLIAVCIHFIFLIILVALTFIQLYFTHAVYLYHCALCRYIYNKYVLQNN